MLFVISSLWLCRNDMVYNGKNCFSYVNHVLLHAYTPFVTITRGVSILSVFQVLETQTTTTSQVMPTNLVMHCPTFRPKYVGIRRIVAFMTVKTNSSWNQQGGVHGMKRVRLHYPHMRHRISHMRV